MFCLGLMISNHGIGLMLYGVALPQSLKIAKTVAPETVRPWKLSLRWLSPIYSVVYAAVVAIVIIMLKANRAKSSTGFILDAFYWFLFVCIFLCRCCPTLVVSYARHVVVPALPKGTPASVKWGFRHLERSDRVATVFAGIACVFCLLVFFVPDWERHSGFFFLYMLMPFSIFSELWRE